MLNRLFILLIGIVFINVNVCSQSSKKDVSKVEIVYYDSITEYNNIYEMLMKKRDSVKDRISLGTKEERFRKIANLGANRSEIYKHYISKEFKKIRVASNWVHISEIDSSSFDHYLVIRNDARIKEKTGRIFLTYVCYL